MGCEGCIEGKEVQCQFQMYGSVAMAECPCGNCIIKMICEYPCEEYTTYSCKIFHPHPYRVYKEVMELEWLKKTK